MADIIRNAYPFFMTPVRPARAGDGVRGRPAWTDRAIAAVATIVTRWSERAAQRRLLATLDDRLLDDIGVSRVEAAREANKPFWQA
jgi:uncharacterized protein YjiS (DUF1127 family)